MFALKLIILIICLLALLLMNAYIKFKDYEETMKPETPINGKAAYGFDLTDLIIMQRSVEYFVKQAKDAEKIIPKELKKSSQITIKQANKTLKKLKAIRKYYNI